MKSITKVLIKVLLFLAENLPDPIGRMIGGMIQRLLNSGVNDLAHRTRNIELHCKVPHWYIVLMRYSQNRQ